MRHESAISTPATRSKGRPYLGGVAGRLGSTGPCRFIYLYQEFRRGQRHVPETLSHGTFRLAMYFDGSGGKVNQDNERR